MQLFFFLLTSLQGRGWERRCHALILHRKCTSSAECEIQSSGVKPWRSRACPWYQVRKLAFLKIYFTVSFSTTKHKSLRDPFFQSPLFASSKHLRAVFIPTTVYCHANTIIFSLYKQREIVIHPVCYYTCWAEGCSKSHDCPWCPNWNSIF